MELRYAYFFIVALNMAPIQLTHAGKTSNDNTQDAFNVITQVMIVLFSQVLTLSEDDKENIKAAFEGTKNSDEATIGKYKYKHELFYSKDNLYYFHFHSEENHLESLFSYAAVEKPSQERIEYNIIY